MSTFKASSRTIFLGSLLPFMNSDVSNLHWQSMNNYYQVISYKRKRDFLLGKYIVSML